MEGKDRALTARQQGYFEYMRQAKEQGLSLTAYCEKLGLNVRSLYQARRELVKKGVLPRTQPPKKKERSQFVAVQVAPGGSNGGVPVCRVRHPSGWTIECSGWPEASWVTALMQGGGDAAA